MKDCICRTLKTLAEEEKKKRKTKKKKKKQKSEIIAIKHHSLTQFKMESGDELY